MEGLPSRQPFLFSIDCAKEAALRREPVADHLVGQERASS